MKITVHIDDDIIEQMSTQLRSTIVDKKLIIDKNEGEGDIRFMHFPTRLEFYHFSFMLKDELELTCVNPAKSDYFLLKINLSDKVVEKKINGQLLDVQKLLPSGIIYYTPNTTVVSHSKQESQFEVVLIRFHKSLLSTYFENGEDVFLNIRDTMMYEDLDFKSEESLMNVIQSGNKLKSHSHLLSFLSMFFEKLGRRVTDLKYVNLHPEDNRQIFTAASLLRTPTNNNVPTIEQLAKTANMGKTKFKNKFKQVFGIPPKKYHQKIKMEYAIQELANTNKSTTEIAYELGYSHPSKFTRAFKNYYGNSPSKYK